jgi:hypothetical protein
VNDAEAQGKALQRIYGSIGGHKSWAATRDRDDRMANAWAAGVTGMLWHAKPLFGEDVDLEQLTPAELAQVKSARKRWFAELTAKSLKSRQRKKAQRLRAQADELEALADNTAEPDGAA